MRFSTAPVSDDLTAPAIETGSIDSSARPVDGGENHETPAEPQRETPANKTPERTDPERERARRLIEHIGAEFARLRKIGRSTAWADFRNQVAQNGSILITSGTITFDQWAKTLKEIDGELAKEGGGSADSPGDTLAEWLSEKDKPVKKKKVKEVTQ